MGAYPSEQASRHPQSIIHSLLYVLFLLVGGPPRCIATYPGVGREYKQGLPSKAGRQSPTPRAPQQRALPKETTHLNKARTHRLIQKRSYDSKIEPNYIRPLFPRSIRSSSRRQWQSKWSGRPCGSRGCFFGRSAEYTVICMLADLRFKNRFPKYILHVMPNTTTALMIICHGLAILGFLSAGSVD